MTRLNIWVCLLTAGMALTPAGASTEWSQIKEGTLKIQNDDLQGQDKTVPTVAPLRHTEVQIQVCGFVAEATVTQEFYNPLDRPIEATYVFPLPADSAVNATEMRIGERIIRGKIQKRQEARRQYEQARDQGKRASLLEQERPNIFTQSVANIGPRETVHVLIRYVQTLPYADGRYELVFPMVVGPRYIPGDQLDRPRLDPNGRMGDTDRVPDASRITPPALAPDERCGQDIQVTVDLDAAVPIQDLRSRTHRVDIQRKGESAARIALHPEDRIPNKDLVLEIATAGKMPEIGLVAHHTGTGGYFTLVFQPPAAPSDDQVRPREIVCVLDTSGSMTGRPIELAREAVVGVLKELLPTDHFNVLVFSNQVEGFRDRAVPATPENLRAGIAYVQSRQAGGGTEMLKGVTAALRADLPEGYLRIIAFFTDGYVGNEREILREIAACRREARLFSFGVGSSVNRYLLEEMALLGRGTAQYCLLNDTPTQSVEAFRKRINRPILTDVTVRIEGTNVSELVPWPIPDVFDGVPVYTFGRYDKGGKAVVEISGRIGASPVTTRIDVDLPGPSKDHSPLPCIWARQKIRHLEMQALGQGGSGEEAITQLALEYSLMSAYTSFVAIDETPTNFGGPPQTVAVNVPVPDGVSYETTIGPIGGSGGGLAAGPSGGFHLFGGGPVGLIGLAVAAILAAARRRKGPGGR